MSNQTLLNLYKALVCITTLIILMEISIDKIFNHSKLIAHLKNRNIKTIQLLTGRFNFKNWELQHDLGNEPFKFCPEKRCYAFKNLLSQKPYEEADGIMVHG